MSTLIRLLALVSLTGACQPQRDATAVVPATAVHQMCSATEVCAHPVTLPHRASDAASAQPMRYRITVPRSVRADPDGGWGLVVLAEMSVEARIRTEALLNLSPSSGPHSNHCNHPALFVARTASSAALPTEVFVDVFSPAGGHGGLRSVHVGGLRAATAHHRRLRGLMVTSAEIATAVALLSALLMFSVWVAKPKDRAYLYFSMACALFALNSLHYHVLHPPMSYWAWDSLMNAAVDGFIVSLVLFTRALTRRPPGRIVPSLLVYGAVAALLPLVMPAQLKTMSHDIMHAGSLAIGAFGVVTLVKHRGQLSAPSRSVLVGAGVVFCVVGAHDLLRLTGLSPGLGLSLVPFGVLLMVIACVTALVGDLVRVLKLEQGLTATLEARVREKTEALQQTHQHLLKVSQDKTLSEERERISRELHDGTAGQLVTLLAVLETEPQRDPAAMASFVREALDDLRMTIQSIDPTVASLAELLGTLRPFIEARVQQAGAELRWRVHTLDDSPTASDVLHAVQRILQEATTNAVRHGGISTLTIEARSSQATGVELVIQDDGHGFDAQASPGRGLRNMKSRAEQIGAQLLFETHNGVTLRLRLPDAPTPDQPRPQET